MYPRVGHAARARRRPADLGRRRLGPGARVVLECGWPQSSSWRVADARRSSAIAPQVVWRVWRRSSRRRKVPVAGTTRRWTCHRAPVLVPAHSAQDLRDVVDYVDAGTPPGAPLFVYPVDADLQFPGRSTQPDALRPLHSGHADPAIRRGDRRHSSVRDPRYVVWDHIGVVVWQTDPANRPLSDYIWRCYREVAAFRHLPGPGARRGQLLSAHSRRGGTQLATRARSIARTSAAGRRTRRPARPAAATCTPWAPRCCRRRLCQSPWPASLRWPAGHERADRSISI